VRRNFGSIEKKSVTERPEVCKTRKLGTGCYASGQTDCEEGHKGTRGNHMETDVKGEACNQGKCYAIQTTTGQEDILIQFMRERMDPVLIQEVFTPKREMNRRIGGKWKITTEKMFPGYLLLVTNSPEAVFLSLKKIPKRKNLLHDADYYFISLTDAEQAFIEKIGKDRGDHTFRLSRISLPDEKPYQKGDRVKIIDGDLKNFTGEIIEYNLRKRKAIIRTRMFGGTDVDIHVGIEIIEKQNRPG